MHLPHTHVPRPLHSDPSLDKQVTVETGHPQISPAQPSAHTHSPNTHTPRPEGTRQNIKDQCNPPHSLSSLIVSLCVCEVSECVCLWVCVCVTVGVCLCVCL